mgnify:CR=1 FL=1
MSREDETTKTGVILLNMGGPDDLEAIEGYLHRIFMDPMLIQLPAGFLYRRLLARFVAGKRAKKVASRYELIGGGSPLLRHTEVLASHLESALSVPVRIAMRYSLPGAKEAVASLEDAGVTRAVALPLYPQFSYSTTGSSLADLERASKGKIELDIVDRHSKDPGFISSLAEGVEHALSSLKSQDDLHVLFTSHSIPEKYTAAGDPYIAEVKATVGDVVDKLPGELSTSLAFQSAPKVGKWHGPSVEEEVPRLVERGVRRLVVCPVTFVSENLETLYDLDHVLAGASLEAGIVEFVRTSLPGESTTYLDALNRIIQEIM